MADTTTATSVVAALHEVTDSLESLVAALRGEATAGLTPAQEDQFIADINVEIARLEAIVNG